MRTSLCALAALGLAGPLVTSDARALELWVDHDSLGGRRRARRRVR